MILISIMMYFDLMNEECFARWARSVGPIQRFAISDEFFHGPWNPYWSRLLGEGRAHDFRGEAPMRAAARPLSTRRFGQPRRLGSRRASSPSGARAGGLSGKPCACSPSFAPFLPPCSSPHLLVPNWKTFVVWFRPAWLRG